MADIGNGVVIAGIVLQLAWFVYFVVVAVVFHHRMNTVPTSASMRPEVRWRSYLYTLYFVSGLVMLRSLFRVIEYAQGNSGYLMTNEAFLYVFDSLPMFIVAAWLIWKHPGEIGLVLSGQKAVTNGFQLYSSQHKASGFRGDGANESS